MLHPQFVLSLRFFKLEWHVLLPIDCESENILFINFVYFRSYDLHILLYISQFLENAKYL